MTKPVETIQANDSIETAWNRMQERRIHHLVVMDGRDIVGVLSDRDLGGKRTALKNGKQAQDLMVRSVVFAESRTTVRAAANKMRGRGIGCLPVVDGRRLVGIVTASDLLMLIGRGVERPVAKADRRILGRGRGPRQRSLAK